MRARRSELYRLGQRIRALSKHKQEWPGLTLLCFQSKRCPGRRCRPRARRDPGALLSRTSRLQVYSHDLELSKFVGGCLAVSTNVRPEPELTAAAAAFARARSETADRAFGGIMCGGVASGSSAANSPGVQSVGLILSEPPAARVRCLGWRNVPISAAILMKGVTTALLELKAEMSVNASHFNCSSAPVLTAECAAALFSCSPVSSPDGARVDGAKPCSRPAPSCATQCARRRAERHDPNAVPARGR